MKNYSDLDKRHIWHPYTQASSAFDSICIAKASGNKLFDVEGREYLDMVSSWWVNIHGHAHPKIVSAIAAQASELDHVIFADFTHAPAAELAAQLVKSLHRATTGQLNRVFYSESGSSAVEIALKQTLHYWKNVGKAYRTGLIAFDGGYHGDTVGAMSVGRKSGFFEPYAEFLFDVETVPFPHTWPGDEKIEQKEKKSLEALQKILATRGREIGAIIFEPLVQGASGMRMCRPEFVAHAAQMARDYGLLIIFDEVMTGFGRTGTFCAYEQCGVVPDILCLAKGLTGGFLPLAVTICDEKIYDAFKGAGFDRALAHGHSYTANPIACAAALASLSLFKTENTLQKIEMIQACHQKQFMPLAAHSSARHCRILGTIAAVDLDMDTDYGSKLSRDMRLFFLNRGILIRPLGQTIYILPPYCTTAEELQKSYDVVSEALTVFGRSAIPEVA
ncbi:MAG: adenosylmethionine--8-amino-7-oxononanoate transaminase [Alphaproteobacteria bacterium]|nr:MAG: adenosylmethionine--8-amino-7-oxononanoate transaminase [Alphaproteobacteria bacterium]